MYRVDLTASQLDQVSLTPLPVVVDCNWELPIGLLHSSSITASS